MVSRVVSAGTPLWVVNVLFSLGILLAVVAQVIMYRSGERNKQRYRGMVVGIVASLLLFFAGQIAGAKLRVSVIYGYVSLRPE